MESIKMENESVANLVKILVVDDREDNLFSIETILERDDYQIVKAASGMAALKILLKQEMRKEIELV
jgi:CheY-like chemotaxis protein